MNRDRYPDVYMPMGNMAFPRSEAPLGSNAMPMRSENTMGQGLKHRENMNMECIDHETVLEDVQIAHAYVPYQKWCPTFMPMTALKKGTAFPGLVDVYGWESRHGMGGENL
jgi:hypothetical protein